MTLYKSSGLKIMMFMVVLLGVMIMCLSSVSALATTYWTFNDTKNDMKGIFNLTASGSTSYAGGIINESINVSGGTYLYTVANESINLRKAGNITYNFWINASKNIQYLLGYETSGAGGWYFLYY